METVPSLADWLEAAPYESRFLERRLGADAPMHLVLLHVGPGQYADPPSDDVSIHQVIQGDGSVAEIDFGAGTFESAILPGRTYVAPAGETSRYTASAPLGVLVACLPATRVLPLVREVSGGVLSDLGPLHRGTHSSDRTRDLLRLLWEGARDDAPASNLYVDGLLNAIIASLVRMALPARLRPAATPLSPSRLRRAQALLGDRLDEGVTMADVAGALGMGAHHFARAFKAATGVPPHAWRNARRIAHAQALLADPRIPISEVAVACGFASQAHLTTAFRRATGFTPAAFRRAH